MTKISACAQFPFVPAAHLALMLIWPSSRPFIKRSYEFSHKVFLVHFVFIYPNSFLIILQKSTRSRLKNKAIEKCRPLLLHPSRIVRRNTNLATPSSSHSIMEEVEQNAVFKKHVGDYELGEVLGQGTFATVRRARHVKSGLEYAVKIIDKQQM